MHNTWKINLLFMLNISSYILLFKKCSLLVHIISFKNFQWIRHIYFFLKNKMWIMINSVSNRSTSTEMWFSVFIEKLITKCTNYIDFVAAVSHVTSPRPWNFRQRTRWWHLFNLKLHLSIHHGSPNILIVASSSFWIFDVYEHMLYFTKTLRFFLSVCTKIL